MTIGVAVTLYNGERFLIHQLETLRDQTRPADRVVLCDDGSRDTTVRIVEDFIRDNSLEASWELVINEKNLGYARNFYHAMELCGTELLYLSDQDDLWRPDKLEKMTAVMESNPQIDLLCCRHGMVDGNGERMRSFLEREGSNTMGLTCIDVQTIMRAYRWPGMAMCVRESFFRRLLPSIGELPLAHDMVFALCAADGNGFYEYDYVGVDHRRHDNNLANEESRVFALLNLKRKLRDMRVYNTLLEGLLRAQLPVRESTVEQVQYRLELSKMRETAVRDRSFRQLQKVYRSDNRGMLRFASLVCDIWLLCFGKYGAVEK